ncbi:MAG: PAS domain S-box protein [Deltaproteobacteria bacterium]|nr:PAS domain S-box protein [Deltaproteobacteria bacterium]
MASRLGLGVSALALIVLIGWGLDLDLLKQVIPGLVEMKLVTAVGFALAGAALRMRASAHADAKRIGVGLAALLLVWSAGQLGLAFSAYDFDFGSELFGSRGHFASGSSGTPEMSPATAIAFCLVAIATMVDRRWPRLGHAVAIGAFVVALVEFLAFLYEIEPLQRFGRFEGMPFHTSLGLLAASLGALFLRPDVGLPSALVDDSIAGRELRRVLPVSIGVPLVLGALARVGDREGLWSDAYDMAILASATMIALLTLTVVLYRSLRDPKARRTGRSRRFAPARINIGRPSSTRRSGSPISRQRTLARANARLCEILGYEEVELLELTYAAVSHLDDLDVDVKQWELLCRGEIDAYGVERRFRSKSGEEIIAEVRLVRDEDADGNLVHFIAVIQDITGRKISEGTMRVYQRALAAARNGIVITDATRPDHPINYVNDAFLEITGYEASEVLGKNCRFLNEKARDQAALEEIREAIAQGEACSVLMRNHRKDGTGFWNQLSIAPVENADGKVAHFVGIMTDATESVRAGAERDDLLRVAENANRAKDRFLAIVSHELRSPLNAILAWSSILEDEGGDEVVGRAASAISAAVRSQTRLIDDLLDVSRIRGQRLEVDMARIELASAIRDVVEQMRPIAEEHAIELAFESPSAVVFVDADPERITQIVRNLVDNALKFTPAQGRIEVVLAVGERSVELTITDTGPGLDPADLDRIFDEFWQGSAPGAAGTKGLGLGLPIVRYLVERHAGSIEAKSEGAGRGLSMIVRLPRSDAPSGEARRSQPVEIAASDSPPKTESPDHDLTGLEIVVVDDDPAWVEATSAALTKRKAIVRTAHSVAEAQRHFERGAPDLLVSDIGLPDRSGLDLIGAVRRLPQPTASVLAIAVTGMTDAESRARVRRAGFDACLGKPIPPDVVLEEIGRLRGLLAAPSAPERRVLVVADSQGSADPIVEAPGPKDIKSRLRAAKRPRPRGFARTNPGSSWSGAARRPRGGYDRGACVLRRRACRRR